MKTNTKETQTQKGQGKNMAQLFGQANPNFRHGNYSVIDTCPEIKQALAKDLLYRIMTTKFDAKTGRLPGFTQEEINWAFDVCRNRPEWAEQTLRNLGFKDQT